MQVIFSLIGFSIGLAICFTGIAVYFMAYQIKDRLEKIELIFPSDIDYEKKTQFRKLLINRMTRYWQLLSMLSLLLTSIGLSYIGGFPFFIISLVLFGPYYLKHPRPVEQDYDPLLCIEKKLELQMTVLKVSETDIQNSIKKYIQERKLILDEKEEFLRFFSSRNDSIGLAARYLMVHS